MFKHSKDVGLSPVAFFRFASFFVFIFDFVHNWIHLFEFDMRLCNKYSTVNNFKKPKSEAFYLHVINSYHAEHF